MILSYTLILPISQLQTRQVKTSQIRSHTEDLALFCAHFMMKIYEQFSHNDGF